MIEFSRSVIRLNQNRLELKDQLQAFLIRQNSQRRSQLTRSTSQLGLKLPLNPAKIKIGEKGEVLVKKKDEEQWLGEYGAYYKYGGLYGERALPEGTIL